MRFTDISFIVAVGTVLLTACANTPDPLVSSYNTTMAACIDVPPPTNAEIRIMPTKSLKDWYQSSQKSSELVADIDARKARGQPMPDVSPCVRAVAVRKFDFEQELKRRKAI